MHKLTYAPSYCTMMQSENLNILSVEWTETFQEFPAGTVLICYHPTCGRNQETQQDNPSLSVWIAVPVVEC